LAVVSSVLLAAAYVMYASGILMPSTKSGRIAPPDFSGDAAGSRPAAPSTQQLLLMAGSKSKAPILTTPTTKLTLLPGSKAPARLVEPAVPTLVPAPAATAPTGTRQLLPGSKAPDFILAPRTQDPSKSGNQSNP
jgi:hypothetical protein